MLRYAIPGYARLRMGRHKRLISYLGEEGWEHTREFATLCERQPGSEDELLVEILALDLNGTLTLEGVLVPGVAECLKRVQEAGVKLLILTGDVRGTAESVKLELAASGVNVELVVCKDTRGTAFAKLARLIEFDLARVAFIGNGQGDSLAVRATDFSIATTQSELSASATVGGAVGHATSITHALNGLLDEKLMRASFHQ